MANRRRGEGSETSRVPLPIQTFLWRQTSPFLRPKLSKQCEASCVSFERIVVQNIHHGLSPSLCEALQTTPRWLFVQTAFPHIAHCCAAILRGPQRLAAAASGGGCGSAAAGVSVSSAGGPGVGALTFSSMEAKLLYTLHWALLDAASECDAAAASSAPAAAARSSAAAAGRNSDAAVALPPSAQATYPLSSVQLFVYLFAPLLHTMQPESFQTLKLEAGLRIWQPLWEYRAPADVAAFVALAKPRRSTVDGVGTCHCTDGAGSIRAPALRQRAQTMAGSDSVYTGGAELAAAAAAAAAVSSSAAAAAVQDAVSDADPSAVLNCSTQSTGTPQSGAAAVADAQAATYFDVAVLQCLTSQRWAKEGRLWALRYLDGRLEAIAAQQESHAMDRRARSGSVPLPVIKVSGCGSIESIQLKDSHVSAVTAYPAGAAPQLHPPAHSDSTQGDTFVQGSAVASSRLATEAPVKDNQQLTTTAAAGAARPGAASPTSAMAYGPRRTLPLISGLPILADAPPLKAPTLSVASHGHLDQEILAADVQVEPVLQPRKLSSGAPVVRITPPDECDSEPAATTAAAIAAASERMAAGGGTLNTDDQLKAACASGSASAIDVPVSLPSRRCKSEPCIALDLTGEFQEEAVGSMHYIQDNGMLNYAVLLRAVRQAVLSDASHVVCLHAVSIVRRLLRLGVMGAQNRSSRKPQQSQQPQPAQPPPPSQHQSDSRRSSCTWHIGGSPLGQQQQSAASPTDSGDGDEKAVPNKTEKAVKELYQLALDAVIGVVITIGCSFCSHYVSQAMADVRDQAIAVLTDLYDLRPLDFRAAMRDFVTNMSSLEQVLRFLHAYVGYCRSADDLGGHGVSSLNAGGASSYATNFGHSISGEGHRGIEGVILALTLGILVTRLVPIAADLSKPRNVAIYGDARRFLAYCQRNHGGTLHRVALSGLIDIASQSAKRASKTHKNVAAGDSRSSLTIAEAASVKLSEMETKSSTRKEAAFATESHHVLAAGGSSSSLRPSSDMPAAVPQQSQQQQTLRNRSILELPRGLQRRHSVPDRMQDSSCELNKQMLPDSPSSAEQRTGQEGSGRTLSVTSAMSSQSDEDIVSEDGEEISSKGFSFRVVSQATLALVKARRRVKERLKLISSKQRLQETARSDKVVRRRSTGDCASPRPLSEASDKEARLIDIRALAAGMARFNLLLNMCEPGTFPEPEFMASLLDLDAPVIGRACVLLECAHFVHRCNAGDWPPWMRGYVTGGVGHGRSMAPAAFKKSVTLQRTAALMFYRWAEAIGARLEELLEENSFDIFTVVTAADFEFRLDDSEEDYLVETPMERVPASGGDRGSSPPTGGVCPPSSLRSVACLLLSEVTSFLRESYQHMPVAHPCAAFQGSHARFSRTAGALSSSTAGGGGPVSPGHSLNSEHVRSTSPTLDGTETGRSQPQQQQQQMSQAPRSAISGGPSATGVLGSATSLNSTTEAAITPSTAAATSTSVVLRKTQGRMKKTSVPNMGQPSLKAKRSIKLKKNEGWKSSSRKVSSISQHEYLCSEDGNVFMEEDEDFADIDPFILEIYDDLHNKMSWLKVMIKILSLSNFVCKHGSAPSASSSLTSSTKGCHPLCYSRQCQSARLLATAIARVYAPRPAISVSPSQHQPTFSCRPSASLATTSEKRPSLTKLVKSSSSSILLLNVMETMGGNRRKSLDRLLPASLQSPTTSSDSAQQCKENMAPVVSYLKKHADNLMVVPLTLLTKAAALLSSEDFSDTVAIAWELLLHDEQETAAAAASFILIAALQVPAAVQGLILRELSHAEPLVRLEAISKYHVLWHYRHQVWCRLEPGASSLFKVPPPSIDYTLPSPPLGLPEQIVADPPWRPHLKLKLEELAANQETTKSLVTATNTRRKQQQEMIAKALIAEEISKRDAREAYPYSTAALTILASATQGMATAGGAHKADEEEGMEDTAEPAQTPKEVVHAVFPSCLCYIGLFLLDLIDDKCDVPDINGSYSSVSRAAERVLWQCIIEDPVLFLRYPFERLTHVDQQDRVFCALRRLVFHYRRLPANVAYVLFNNLIGYVLFCDRFPHDVSQSAACKALSILWLLVPSVHGLSFKNLKSTLKKVQSEPNLMVTAHLPCTKKIIVHGPDQSLPPQQFIVHEDTQFLHILNESLDYFNVTDNLSHYYLLDIKSGQIHNKNNYVRDFYVFRRTNVPQLRLMQINPDIAFARQQKQALDLKFVEIGRTLLTSSILKHTSAAQMENHVLFLHEEFLKQLAFPRRALETEFAFHKGGNLGREMLSSDKIHKLTWLNFLETFFLSMPGSFGWMNEMQLFLNVINGILILHAEDHGMLRRSLALYVNSAYHFKQVFSNDGFLKILPTVLRVYGAYYGHEHIRNALEFVHKQFYILHRKAYLLQLLGSAEPFLSSTSKDVKFKDTHLFRLLCVLEEKNITDELDVLDFIHAKKPLRAMDFCYESDDDFKVLHAINSAIAVIVYATESYRATQMLCLLDALMPLYVEHVSDGGKQQRGEKVELAKAEAERFESLAHSIKVLVSGSELLARNMNVTQHRYLEGASSTGAHGKRTHYHDDVEDSVISARHLEEGRYVDEDAELQSTTREFRRPRDALLSLVATFLVAGGERLKANKKHLSDTSYRNLCLLDAKSHEQLAEVAHSLLKVGTYDPVTMATKGLQRYITEILPLAEWSADTSGATRRPANVIIKRLERIFVKVQKRTNIRSGVDWDACAMLIRGVCCTLELHPTLQHAQHLKNLVHTCVSIVLQDGSNSGASAGNLAHHRMADQWQSAASSPNHEFCSVIAKLAASHALATGEIGGLEHLCTSTVQLSLGDHCEAVLVNFFLPLCLRVGGCRKECQRLQPSDVHFMLSFVLLCLNPQSKQAALLRPTGSLPAGSIGSSPLTMTAGSHYGSQINQPGAAGSSSSSSELLQKAALLSLKVITTCFPEQLDRSWWLVAQSVVEAAQVNSANRLTIWKFLDFVVAVRNPLYVHLKSFIIGKFLTKRLDSDQEYVIQHRLKQRLAVNMSSSCYSRLQPYRTQLLKEFSAEVQKLRYAQSRSGNEAFSPRSLSAKSSKGWKRKVSLITRMTSEEAALATHPQLNVMSVREPKEPLLLAVHGCAPRPDSLSSCSIREESDLTVGSRKGSSTDPAAEVIVPQSAEKLHRHGAFYQPPMASVATSEPYDDQLLAEGETSSEATQLLSGYVTPNMNRKQSDVPRRRTFKQVRRPMRDLREDVQQARAEALVGIPLGSSEIGAELRPLRASSAGSSSSPKSAARKAVAAATGYVSPKSKSGLSTPLLPPGSPCLEPQHKDVFAMRSAASADKSSPLLSRASLGAGSMSGGGGGAKSPRSVSSVSSSRSDRILHIDTSSSDEEGRRGSDLTLHVDV